MKTVTPWLLGAFTLLVCCPALRGESTPIQDDPGHELIRNHAAFLNELSDRRRLNTLFANEAQIKGVTVAYSVEPSVITMEPSVLAKST